MATAAKAPTKTEILSNIADTTELSKKEVGAVLEALSAEIAKAIGKKGPGSFAIPGLCKIVVQRKDATKACELTDWKNEGWIDTLAAAYAESGDFTNAIKWQQKATELASAEEKADYHSRLALYKSGEPYREEPKK